MPRKHTLAIPREVARKLGYYVYLYTRPGERKPFYIGKGKGRRALAHLDENVESEKKRVFDELKQKGLAPRLEFLAHGLNDEETALRVEAAVIDVLGLGKLTNQVRGWKSVQLGRLSLERAKSLYAAKKVKIIHPVILIRINQRYREDMSPIELLESTRGVWRVDPKRNDAKYALAVFEGVVIEVYTIIAWMPAGSQHYRTRQISEVRVKGRSEFRGQVAPTKIRNLYRGRSVEKYLPRGNQNPIAYEIPVLRRSA